MTKPLTPDQEALKFACVELARRIALTGKGHGGPCNQEALVAYCLHGKHNPHVSPRRNAIKQGLKQFHGSACKVCGNTLRDTSTCHCVQCRKEKRRKNGNDYAEAMRQWGQNRQNALAAGLITYEGRACHVCGGSTRYAKNKSCVTCTANTRIEHRSKLAMNAKAQCEEIAAKFGVTLDEVMDKTREKPVVQARHAIWAQLRHRGYSYPRIGSIFGVDHSTVISAVRKQMGLAA